MKQTKVLLINPPSGMYIRDNRCQSKVSDMVVSFPRPPHELIIMATILKNNDSAVFIKDYPMQKDTMEEFERDVKNLKPVYVLINATIPSLSDDLSCAQVAKSIDSNLITVLRCGSIEYQAEEVMQNNPCLDIILYGETDFTLNDIINTSDLSRVKGIYYRNGNNIYKTTRRAYIDLNELPMVDRELIDTNLYVRPDTGERVALIEVSRGCPYPCIFCLTPVVYGKVHRKRNIIDIIAEVKHCIDRYNTTCFHFKSDLFSFDREWVIQLCSAIIKEKLNIRWFANSRIDSVDEELLVFMKKSGCFALSFGVESGSQKTLNTIRKGIKKENIASTLVMCRNQHIQTYVYFMIGFPDETKEDIDETIKCMMYIQPDFVDIYFPYLFPGTELYELIDKKNCIADNCDSSYVRVQFNTSSIKIKELRQTRKKALLRFYLRPKLIVRTLMRYKSMKAKWRIIKLGIQAIQKMV